MTELPVSLATLILSFLGAIGAGTWFASSQVSALGNLSRRVDDIEEQSEARETEARQRDKFVSAIDNRLARMEGQLEFLVGARLKDAGD